MPVVKTVSPIVFPVAPIEVPSKIVPSANINHAFIIPHKKKAFIPSGDNDSSHRMNAFVLYCYTAYEK